MTHSATEKSSNGFAPGSAKEPSLRSSLVGNISEQLAESSPEHPWEEGTFLLGFKEPHKSETHKQSRMTRDTGNKTTLIRKSIKIDSRNRCAQTSDTVIIKKRYQNSNV